MKTPAPFHFYASTAYDWITGPTKEYVLRKLASYAPSQIKAAKKHGVPGIEAVVCKVLLPQAATYTIRNYVPHAITEPDAAGELRRTSKRVPLREYERVLITSSKGASILNPGMQQVTDAELALDDDKPISQAEANW